MGGEYQTNELFQDIKILNNALIEGEAGAAFKKGQLLTAEEDGFSAWDGDFETPVNAVMRNDADIPAGQTSIRQPVAIGEMNLTGIASVNEIAKADTDKLRVAALKGGIRLN